MDFLCIFLLERRPSAGLFLAVFLLFLFLWFRLLYKTGKAFIFFLIWLWLFLFLIINDFLGLVLL
jgi:hypothetical protein